MADEDDRASFRLQLAHQREQIFDLRGGEHGGRLVEDKNVGSPVEKAQDFENLTRVNRRVGGRHPPVDLDPGEGGRPVGVGFGLAPIDQAERRRLPRQDEVFQQGERRRQHELLVDHPDAAREGVCWTVEPDRPVVEHDGSVVGDIDALQDAHQSRFSGPVAADHRVDRPRRDGEVDAIVGDDRAESPRHAAGA